MMYLADCKLRRVINNFLSCVFSDVVFVTKVSDDRLGCDCILMLFADKNLVFVVVHYVLIAVHDVFDV